MTPDAIERFLDDLARISVRHGMRLDLDRARIVVLTPEFGVYAAERRHTGDWMGTYGAGHRPYAKPHCWGGQDITQISSHERLKIVGSTG